MSLEHMPPKEKKKEILSVVVAYVNVAGWFISSMIIQNQKTMHQDMAAGEVCCTLHTSSDNG